MTITQVFQAPFFATSTSDCVEVVYTAVDVQGMFIDAVARGEPENSEIIEYCWDEPGMPMCAIVRNKSTYAISVYEMDVSTGKPRLVQGASVAPHRTKRKRPRMSRDMRLRLWTERWEKR